MAERGLGRSRGKFAPKLVLRDVAVNAGAALPLGAEGSAAEACPSEARIA